jgi:hypothetical protein
MQRFLSKQTACIAMFFLTCVVSSLSADTLIYELQSGSTITPYYGGTPTGPTEPLTGTFSWQTWETNNNYVGFNATALDFESPSFSITLNTTCNDMYTMVLRDPQQSNFTEIVDAVGLYTSPLRIESDEPGTYEGPAEAPTFLNYQDIKLCPPGGGLFAAHITLTAILVPEPQTILLLSIACVLFLGRKYALSAVK